MEHLNLWQFEMEEEVGLHDIKCLKPDLPILVSKGYYKQKLTSRLS